ncbi:MAG: chemotaxis-specific protein-glutamate methyltransferase CheB [Archangiaceae bacterium]|nr:chemotaxis-specific protein-glutamate methyltransferase CheB [Archangiaceae bacterium]
MRRSAPVRVLVIDDSASNRRAITQILESAPDVEVIDRAQDGAEGLEKARRLKPDLITLDLEMPRLDGFAFLRLLQQVAPTPVIVISSYAHRSDVFKALELGAFDFVAKPSRAAGLDTVRVDLLAKVQAVRQVQKRGGNLSEVRRGSEPTLLAVGASTGGPQAVHQLLMGLKGTSACVLVAQHMPPRFTRAFAERLEKAWGQSVTEARGGERPQAGCAFVAPGGKHLVVVRTEKGALELQVLEAGSADKHVPSIDRLFESVARCGGAAAHAVVLTGMGHDGAQGVGAIARAGGVVWAESEQTAVIPGMPQAAMKTGHVTWVLPLHELTQELAKSVG